ncbi:Golgi to ER traffic- protein [Puccinia graminis f. sp. tritici]|uniref:Golgi to ER traffic-protein n=1 Tax=Puccinia graminis f. sp. tritici TaxID=56615 RepID=A0A5B0PE96_PUCGR|nr:Golgi to ER traffic- protein [Puccinia graminis f. sp. tritici]
MAHDTSNVSSPATEPPPSVIQPMFSSSPQHIPTSPASEPRRSVGNVLSGPKDRPGTKAERARKEFTMAERARKEFNKIVCDKVEIMRNQAGAHGPHRKGSSKPKGPPVGAKSGQQVTDWVTVPPKKLPKQIQSLTSAQAPSKASVQSAHRFPTPDDFRRTGRDGAVIDPALSEDENGSAEEQHVNETLTPQAAENVNAVEAALKKKSIKSPGQKATSSGSGKMTPKVVIQKSASRRDQSNGRHIHEGQRFNSKLLAAALARHEEATRGMDSPDNMIPVGNGELMSLDECRAFLDRFPNISPGGGATPTKALSTGSSGKAAQTSSSSTPAVAAMPNIPDVTPHDPNRRGVPKNPKPYLTTDSPSDSTPLHRGMMNRTPSTSSSINNAMLANLATASIDQLKSMRRICSRTKEMLSTSVSEIRAEDLHLLVPGAYGFQDRHLRLMTRYCSQLDEKIAEAENAGISDSIEVIDLTTDDPQDNDPSSSSVLERSKILSRPSEKSASDASPVLAKKIRPSVSTAPPGQYIQPNLPPYSFRDIPDKDLLAGIAPKFPVNRQPSISEFTSQFQPNLSLPYSPIGAGGVHHGSSSKPRAPGVNNSIHGDPGVTDIQLPITQASDKNTVPTPGLSSSPRPGILPTGPTSKSGDVNKAPQPPAPAISSTDPNSRSGAVHKASQQAGTRPVRLDHPKKGKSSTALLATSADGVPPKDSARDSVVDDTSGDPVSKASEKEGRSFKSPTNTKEKSGHIQKAADVSPTGADLDDEAMEAEPEPKKKVRGKGLGKGHGKAKEKAEKTTKKKLADMTPEEKAARQEERKEKAKVRKEEKANSVHAIPPQPGNLLAPMWTPKECEEARRAHKKMLIDSRNPQWDFGPELMDLVADMILTFKDDVQADKFYTKSPQFTPEPHMTDAILEVFEGDFPGLIMKSPRLLQVDAGDPFWKKEAVDLSIIKKAHDSKDSVKAASWITLYGMMLRVDHYADYTEDTNTVKLFEGAFRKIHTLTVSSFNEFHRYVVPSEKPVDKSIPSFKQDTALQAGRFVINKIKSLKVGAATSAHHGNARTGNGLMLLQKRIWDTLLCVLMMQQSLFQQDLEHCIQTGTYPNQTMLVSQHMSANKRAQSLYKHGDVKDTKNAKAMKEWGEDRLAAFGSMAIFFLYGAAGWWQFLTDSHHYNQKDVWVLVHLAKGKSDWIYKNGHLIKRRPEDTPWYRIDSFVRWLLVKTNMHVRISDKVDWEAAPKFWAKHVTSQNIARLALQDVLSEVCLDTPLKSFNFNGEPAPDVELDEDVQDSVEMCRVKLTAGWQGLIEGTTDRVDPADGEISVGSSLTEEEDEEEAEEEDEEEAEEEVDDSEEGESEEEGEIRAPRPSGKRVHQKIPSSSSSESGTGPEDEDTDPHRSDSDGGVEERQRRRREHPFIHYTSKVQKS